MIKLNKNVKSKPTDLWAYKAASIIAAVLIWVMVTVTQNPLDEKIFMVSLELRSLPETLVIEKTINQVQVRVQGASAVINELTAADIAAYVDLAGFKAGAYELEVMVEHPANVQVISRLPATIEVELKETLTELFPLAVEVLGEPAQNYELLEANVSPAEVKLTGTEDFMRRVAKVYVAASIQDIAESYEKDHSVVVMDVAGNDITAMFSIEPKVARVTIPVVYEQPEQMVAVRVPITGQPALGYQLSLISATPSMVRVFGDLNRLQNLYYVDTEPVDVSDLKANTSRTVRLALGNGFSAYPSEVTVALKIEPVNSATVTKTMILCRNVGEGFTAEVEPLTLSIMVYGPETFVAALDEAEIVAYVDCAQLTEGEYELPIRVSLPANILLMNTTPDTAAVTIHAPDQAIPDEETPLAETGAEAGADEV